MALFTTIPTRITNPSNVSMSRGCVPMRLSRARPPTPPAAATGTEIITTRGNTKDSKSTAIEEHDDQGDGKVDLNCIPRLRKLIRRSGHGQPHSGRQPLLFERGNHFGFQKLDSGLER